MPDLPAVDPGLERELCAAVADARPRLVELTRALVRFPSLLGDEGPAQDFMEGLLLGMGLAVVRVPIRHEALRDLPGYSPPVGLWDDHDNVVGSLRCAAPQGRSLILNGHIDVVPTGPEELWTTPPFEPRLDGSRLYGRGAGDMKSGLAAAVVALQALDALHRAPAADIHVQSVVEEECTGNGALACLQQGFRADAALIPEPFGRSILEAQVGVLWLTVEVTGRPAHVLDTRAGVNAIEAAFALYGALAPLEQAWNALARELPVYAGHAHPIHFNLGRIRGGEWPSSVPTRCTMELRLGLPPPLSPAQAADQARATLEAAAATLPAVQGARCRISDRGLAAQGFVAGRGEPLLQTLAASHEAATGVTPGWLASTATTDARILRLYGDTPAACYGPDAQHIHGIDESVDLDSVVEVSQVIAVFIARWCGTRPA